MKLMMHQVVVMVVLVRFQAKSGDLPKNTHLPLPQKVKESGPFFEKNQGATPRKWWMMLETTFKVETMPLFYRKKSIQFTIW